MKGKIFNAQEVQSILNGSKVMFREVTRPQLSYRNPEIPRKLVRFEDESGYRTIDRDNEWVVSVFERCPYQVGQKIFVKESFREHAFCKHHYKADDEERKWGIGSITKNFLPAQHMKQEHSRLTLEIADIKVERLQDISEEDCKKEGIGYTGGWNGEDYDNGEFYFGKLEETKDGMNWKNEMFKYPDLAFAELWNATHKKPKEKFEANPFVWVVDFKINK